MKKRLAGGWRLEAADLGPGASPRGNPLLDHARTAGLLGAAGGILNLAPDTWHLRFRIPSLMKKRLRHPQGVPGEVVGILRGNPFADEEAIETSLNFALRSEGR